MLDGGHIEARRGMQKVLKSVLSLRDEVEVKEPKT